MGKVFSLVLMLAFCSTGFASSSAKKISYQDYVKIVLKNAPYKKPKFTQWLTVEQSNNMRDRLMKQEASRSLASNSAYHIEKDLAQIQADLFAAKTPDDLDAMLAKLETGYSSLQTDDARFFAAQFIPLRTFRGVVWKLYPLAKSLRLPRAAAITVLKQISTSLHVFLPSDQWRVVFNYLTMPYVEETTGALARQFQNEGDVQVFFAVDVLNSMVEELNRLNAITISTDLVWDQKFIFGPDSFTADDTEQFKLAGEVEKELLMAGLNFGLSTIASSRAYSAYDAIALSNDMGALFGIDAVLSWDSSGASMKQRVTAMNRHPSYGVLLGADSSGKDGSAWMHDSLQYLQEGVNRLNIAWGALKARPPNKLPFMIGSTFIQGDNSMSDQRIAELVAIVSGAASVHSPVTGKTLTVNLPSYFLSPAANVRVFFPDLKTGFSPGPEMYKSYADSATKKSFTTEYRNYDNEQPQVWPVAAYKGVLPGIATSSDLTSAFQTLSQSLSGAVALIPFVSYMN